MRQQCSVLSNTALNSVFKASNKNSMAVSILSSSLGDAVLVKEDGDSQVNQLAVNSYRPFGTSL